MEFQSGSHSMVEEKGPVSGRQRMRSHNATLPFDILGLIFHHVADGYPVHLRRLIFVCRSWHDAVFLHPTLWSTIRVDCTLLDIFAPNGALSKLLVKLYIHSCLRWSGSAPLEVSVDLTPLQLNAFKISDDALETSSYLFLLVTDLIGPDGKHAMRWRSFIWRCHRGDYASRVFYKLPLSLPTLEILRLIGVRLDASHSGMFPHCPRLRTVEAHQWAVQPLKNEDCLLVSDLSITTEVVWLSFDLILLSHFPNIRHLTLSTALGGRALFMPDPDYPPLDEVLLPRLQCLRLRGCLPPRVVGCMVAPLLKELELDSYTSIELLGDISLARTVETVRIAIPNLDRTLVPRRVEKQLNSMPALKQLCVPKRFHDWVEKNDLHFSEDVLVVVE